MHMPTPLPCTYVYTLSSCTCAHTPTMHRCTPLSYTCPHPTMHAHTPHMIMVSGGGGGGGGGGGCRGSFHALQTAELPSKPTHNNITYNHVLLFIFQCQFSKSHLLSSSSILFSLFSSDSVINLLVLDRNGTVS